MMAIINGVAVTGTPEEIKRLTGLSQEKKGNGYFNIPENDVPEHVKRYGQPMGFDNKNYSIRCTTRAWF